MLDQIGITVADFDASKAFYTRVLAPLGYGPVLEVTPEMTGSDARHLGFGAGGKPDFWIGAGHGMPVTRDGVHVAFSARTHAAVDAFHQAALAAGARDNGAPGIRAHYHPNYYGAFVIDLNGHNLEAVCHAPE
ncbi:VOC family protein [Lysobacter solisilvae (ex Woo and Kim 2020)]|uniref:VOC family protein n=1 Tax=Agrilutibacter terrestris TaxID=2865112 RepID=A0A7H0FWS7_9GAMM|nr:VOC family protein [Lysobacter terrestris]QNP40493.1 VOC family protein [Lysobacter terrestris]